jgi:hypothetical protein
MIPGKLTKRINRILFSVDPTLHCSRKIDGEIGKSTIGLWKEKQQTLNNLRDFLTRSENFYEKFWENKANFKIDDFTHPLRMKKFSEADYSTKLRDLTRE